MLTYKLRIKSISDSAFVEQKQKDYSFAFRKIYKNFDKIKDPEFKLWVCNEFNLDSWDWASLIMDVKTKISQVQTQKKKLSKKIISLHDKINLIVNKKTKRDKRNFFKLNNKLNYCRKSLTKDVVFGGKKLLRKVSLKDENYLDYKSEFSENRLLPIFSAGDKDKKGNRKFRFDFENWTINYNQNKKTHIIIEVYQAKNWLGNLLKIQELASNKKIPVSVQLTKTHINIIFDESSLNNYKLDKTKFIKGDKLNNHQVFKDLENLKFENKIRSRFCGVDLNPDYIGFTICDKLTNGKIKQLYNECINLSHLSTKLNLSSTDERQVYQNNKRKYEICEV